MNLITTNLNKVLNRNVSNPIAFTASDNDNKKEIPVLVPTQNRLKGEDSPVFMYAEVAARLIKAANNSAQSVSELVNKLLFSKLAKVEPEKSVTAEVGKTNVTTLIDGGQIFPKALEWVEGTKKGDCIQIEMFEFQNKDDADKHHPLGGADAVDGSKEQQKLYDTIIKKSKEGVKVQTILDASKWPEDGFGRKEKFYNNLNMVKRLIDAGVDVAIYPRSTQGGTKIQHVKLLAIHSKSTGNKVMIGGENWGNHSPVNHDACVAIETQDKFKGQGSEVDNIIDTVFNKDWKFAWNMTGLYGAMTGKEQHSNLKIIKGILPEAAEYMKVIGEIYNDPKYRERFTKGEFYLPEVKPVKDPAIKVLLNSPVEYKTHGIYDKNMDNESIRTYLLGKKGDKGQEIQGKLNDPNMNYLRAELFVLTHKEVKEKIIERHKSGTLDAKILVSPDLLQKFPYLKPVYQELRKEGVPVEAFKVNEELKQRLHCKWAVLGHKDKDQAEPDKLELLIGSANWSALGLENNNGKGMRKDYVLHNKAILKQIDEKFKKDILTLEKAIKSDPKMDKNMQSIFTNKGLDYNKILENKKALNRKEKELFEQQIELNNTSNDESLKKIRALVGTYHLVEDFVNKKAKYKRGNHECAIVVENQDIAKTFVRQFEKDWEFTINKKEDLAFSANTRKPNCKTQNKFGSQVYTFNKIA